MSHGECSKKGGGPFLLRNTAAGRFSEKQKKYRHYLGISGLEVIAMFCISEMLYIGDI